jgi:hypothetical protein
MRYCRPNSATLPPPTTEVSVRRRWRSTLQQLATSRLSHDFEDESGAALFIRHGGEVYPSYAGSGELA